MIDKSEIGRNIKKLLEGYVEKGRELEITLRPPDYADVFIDREYFNTYCIKTKNFLSNIRADKECDDGFNMSIRIMRDNLLDNYSEYKGAQLQLPASVYEIKDAFQRARITDESYTVSECELYGDDISKILCEDINDIEKLNYLAHVLKRFSTHDHALYRGYIKQKDEDSLTLNELINIAYNLGECEIYYEIFSDEDLGKFYADNGMLEWLYNIDENVWKYLDYRSIGEDIRTKENGIFTEEGYFFNNAEECTVYDGAEYPETFEKDEYIFKVLIAPKQEIGEGKSKGRWLSLPTSKEGKWRFLSELGADSFDDCILFAVLSMDTVIPMFVKDLSQLGVLNSLAHRMRDLDKSGDIAKYKAVIASGRCKNLEEALAMANKLDCFELHTEPSSLIEYAKKQFRDNYAHLLPESFEKHFNFATYAEELRIKGDLFVTEYGVIRDLTPNIPVSTDENGSLTG